MTSVLWDLARRARQATSDRELGFLLVNDSLTLVPFRQAALWLEDEGVWTLSGVVQVDANVPYVQWLDLVARHLHALGYEAGQAFTAGDLPAELASQWAHWWPEHAIWFGSSAQGLSGAGIFLRDIPWTDEEKVDLQEWAEVWWHAFSAMHRPKMVRFSAWRQACSRLLLWQDGLVWWRQRRLQIGIALLAALLWPVQLTVLSPGELVPAHPTVVRAPLDGVIDVFHVQPNQLIKSEQALFSFDEIVIQSKLDVSLQALATAETDYRQTSQMALTDMKSKTQLGLLVGKVEERRAEIEYLQEQLTRARVLAPQAGVVLMDDPSEWIGKPVSTGERILRIAALDDVEIEAWVSLADAISLSPGDSVTLYLSASPLSPVSAKLRYMSHEAVQRPDGSYAYRVRAVLNSPTSHRVGLKGTAKLQGGWVPLSYWVLRRPWATVRAYLGF
jgi:hypothetical protein